MAARGSHGEGALSSARRLANLWTEFLRASGVTTAKYRRTKGTPILVKYSRPRETKAVSALFLGARSDGLKECLRIGESYAVCLGRCSGSSDTAKMFTTFDLAGECFPSGLIYVENPH